MRHQPSPHRKRLNGILEVAMREGGTTSRNEMRAIMEEPRLSGCSACERKSQLLLADRLQIRQEHEVGRFLGVPQKRLARCA